MFLNIRIRIFVTAMLALLFSACSLAPAYVRPNSPIPSAATADSVTTPDDARGVYNIGWYDFFKDPRLRELIAISLEQNKDLRSAVLAIREAKAQYGVQRGERLPMLNVEGTGTYSGKFEESSPEKTYEATAMSSFEMDIFGRLRNMSESAFHTYLATAEAAKAVRISLVSQVAQAYLDERLALERLQSAQNNLKSWRASYSFIEQRVQSGQSSLLDLEQARSMVAAASAGVAQREREVIQAGNALLLLAGSFEQRELPPAVNLTEQSLAELPQGVPSTVLFDRPDIMEAEHALIASNADIGTARAAFFPSISLTGNLGYMSADLSGLFSPATGFWSFLPKITLPLFSGGRNMANLELSEIRKEISIVRYEKAIQSAFREVSDSLQSRANFARQYAAQERYLASQRLVLKLAVSQYSNGVVNYLEVLDAQRSVFQAEQDLLGIRRDQLMNEISLYSALGGGRMNYPNVQ